MQPAGHRRADARLLVWVKRIQIHTHAKSAAPCRTVASAASNASAKPRPRISFMSKTPSRLVAAHADQALMFGAQIMPGQTVGPSILGTSGLI
jgi:hypothetical protein